MQAMLVGLDLDKLEDLEVCNDLLEEML